MLPMVIKGASLGPLFAVFMSFLRVPFWSLERETRGYPGSKLPTATQANTLQVQMGTHASLLSKSNLSTFLSFPPFGPILFTLYCPGKCQPFRCPWFTPRRDGPRRTPGLRQGLQRRGDLRGVGAGAEQRLHGRCWLPTTWDRSAFFFFCRLLGG